MRIVFLLWLLFPAFALCQTKATVRLSIGDCRVEEKNRDDFFHPIQIFKEQELFREIAADFYHTPIAVTGFSNGNYRAVFTNFYGEKISKQFTIANTDTINLNLCTDSLKQYTYNVFSEMSVTDTLVINCSTIACYYDDLGGIKISVSKSVSGFTASVSGNRKGTFLLNEMQKNAIARFYNELLAIEDRPNCTTIDTYAVKFKNKKTVRVDGGCNWRGIDELIRVFYPQ